jgi:hypothetical protein
MFKRPTEFPTTLQGWFTAAVQGLAAQGWEPSFGLGKCDAPVCLYRTATGEACGIGQGIPDARYTPDMEGRSVEDLVKSGMIPGTGVGREDDPLGGIQRLHDRNFMDDSYGYQAQMRARFRDYATLHNLAWPADVPVDGPVAGAEDTR